MSRLAKAFGFVALVLVTTTISATPLQLRVLVDGDRDASTGCSVGIAGTGGFAGVERVVNATVDIGTTTTTVSGITIQRCTAGVLGDPVAVPSAQGAATYANDSGQLLAELGIPWSSLDLGTSSTALRLGFTAQVGELQQAVLTNGAAPIMYPPSTGRRRVVGLTETTIIVDGVGTDWGGIGPLAPGAASGGSSALRLENVFAHSSSSTIWFRFDAKLSGNAPIAAGDTYTVRQGKSVTVPPPGVLANDTDPNNAPLTAALVTQPTHGSVNLAPSGGFTYVHDGTPSPADSFEYKANNGKFDSNTARVDLNVTPNGVPDANNDNYSVAHGGTLTVPQPGVLANDNDPDGDPMRAQLAVGPQHGTVSLAQNGSFTYTHDGSNTLADSFTYRVSDGTALSSTARVNITVGPDQPPVGTADGYTVAEGGTLTTPAPGVLANDTDPDTPANQLTATIATTPAHGTLTMGANGGFTYVHDGSETTSDTFTYRVGDGILTSAPVTVTITVTPVNDAPVAVADSYTTNEDTPLTVPAAGVLANDTDAEGSALTASLVTNAAHGNVVLNANGSFTYTPNANYNGADSFTYAASDGSLPSNTVTVSLTVTAVNDVPTFTAGSNVTVNEDSGAYANAWATAVSAGPADEAGQTLTFNVSNNNNALFAVQPSIAANGTLTFTPAANANGSATITVTLSDNGSNTPPNVNTTGAVTFTITVNSVNDAPTFVVGSNVSVGEDSGAYSAAQATGMLAGPADELGQTLAFNVTNDSNALFAVQPSIAPNGTLTFTPAANASGVATVTVVLTDNGGTANGGVDTSAPQTFTITVTGVNDAPVNTVPGAQTTNEDTPLLIPAISVADVDAGTAPLQVTLASTNGILTVGTTTNLTVGGNNSASVTLTGSIADLNAALATVTFLPTADYNGAAQITVTTNDQGNSGSGGALQDVDTIAITVNPVNDAPSFSAGSNVTVNEDSGAYSAAQATGISAGPADEAGQTLTFNVSNDNNALFSVQPSIAANGTLTFTTAANAFGTATITVSLSDNGGTANGGADTSATQTFTITVTGVNDVPSFTKGADQTVLEDAAAQTVPGWATAISAGAGEGSQTVNFIVTNNNNALFSVQPAVAANGTLTYTLAPNANGTALVTIAIHDDGGTANGGVDTSATQTFNINVTAVNDAPSFTRGGDQTVLEDSGAQTVNGWATSLSAGPADESGQTLNFIATNDNNALFSVQPSVDASGNLTYTPAANAFGTATVTVQIHDNGGTANGGVDTSAAQTFTITVTGVNDAPSFTVGGTVTVLEDAAPYSAAHETAISAGPNEGGQTLTFNVSNNNNSLFSVQPAIAADGTLTFTLAPNANGSALVTVSLSDNGGTANGGVDTSATQSFTINVTAVNDAPSFSAGSNVTVNEDSGAYSAAQASGMSAGPADESGQTLNFIVSNDNNALFSAQPSLDASGNLTFTPTANAFGAATVTVQIHDNGGTANGGVDTSATQTFTITVSGVNDAPVITRPATAATNEDTPLTFNGGNVISVADVDAASGSVTVTLGVANGVLALSGTTGLTVSGNGTNSITASGTLTNLNNALNGLTYTPALNYNGSDTLSIGVNDNGNTGTGGAQTDSNSVAITINAQNDAPVAVADSYSTNEDTPLSVSAPGVLSNDSDVDTPAASLTAVLVTGPASASSFTLNSDGSFIYTPNANFAGSDSFTYKTGDGSLFSSTVTVSITVNAINDAPVNTMPSSPTMQQDSFIALSGAGAIQISDVDAGTSAVKVTLTATNGTMSLNGTTGLSFTTGDGTADASMVFTGTTSAINTSLNGMTFASSPGFFGTASIQIVTDDQGATGAGGPLTDTDTLNITVQQSDQPPVNTVPGTQTINEDTTLTFSSGNGNAISIADPDSTGAMKVTLTVTQGALTLSGITGLSFTVGDGTADATMTFTGSISAINTALAGLSYTPNLNSSGSDTLTITTNDQEVIIPGGPKSDTDIVTINITAVNDAPVITRPAAVAPVEDTVFTFNGGNTISIADVDAASGSLTVTLGVSSGTITLSGTTGLTVSGNGTASITATGTLTNLNNALNGLTYLGSSNFNGADTLTIGVNDNGNTGTGGNATDSKSVTLNVSAVNDAPVATAGGTLNYTENDPATVIDNTITVSDVDSPTLTGATVSISAGFASGQDVLSFTTLGAISAVYNPGTGVLTLSGTDTITNYQAALRTVKYSNSSENPSTAARTISWVVNDGAGANNLSAAVTSTVTVTAVNDAPVLANGSTLAYTENDPATAINSLITVTDVDSTNIVGATVTFTGGYQNGQDVLSYATALGITGTFNAGTGVLTLSGTTTVANYQTALRNVKYNNTSEDPVSAARTVQFQVDDGGAANNLSNTISSTINVTAVNDPPTAAAFTNLPAQAGIAITYPAGKLSGSDLEAGTTITIDTTPINLVNIGSITINANGSFTVTPLPGSAGGTASFQYRVSDNGNPAPGVNGPYATVTFAVAGPAIYFVKNPAVGLANCTLGNECLVATAVSNIGATTNAYIFLGDASTHTPAAAVTLNSGGSIIGQGLTGFANFDTFFSIGAPAQGVLAARPAIGQALPTFSGTVTMNNNSQLRGFNMAPGNNVSAIVASGKSGLAIDLGTITTNTPGGATTYAVDLNTASSGTKFNFGAITANGGGANANGVRFNATSTTTVTFSTINTTNGAAFASSGTGATNFTFGNITSTAGAAVNVGTSSGNFTFANVTSTTGAAVTTSTTGAGNFTFSAVSSTTGRAVDVNTGTGTFTFTSIAANGSATGILVQNVTGAGSFTVNGSGSTAGSGGTVQNCTAKGGDFRNVASLTLKNMNFTNNATANLAAATTCGDVVSGSNNGPTNCNANISLSAGTANILIQNVSATGSKQIGIDGNTISNLTLNGVTVTGNGNEVGEDGVQLYNPSGTLSVSNTSLFKDNAANQFEVGMSTGTLNSTFTGSTFSLTNFPTTAGGVAPSPGNATANAGLLFHANSGSNAAMNATVSGCTFSKIYSYALRWDSANGTSTGTINFGLTGNGNTFTDNGLGIGISSTGNGAITYNIKDNTLTNNTAVTTTFSTSPVSTSFSANATRTGVVDNNTIGVNGGAVNSGCFVPGCSGLELTDSGAQGAQNLVVTNNKVFHVAGSGILVTSTSSSTETLRVKISNNLVGNYDGGSANPGIMVQDGNTTPNGVTATCVDISNNTVQGLWATSTSHKSAIRVLSTHALQFSLTNFNSATEYSAGVVTAGCTTQCTGAVGVDGNVADFLSSQNPATVTAQGSTGGSSASQNRTGTAAVWTGSAGACP